MSTASAWRGRSCWDSTRHTEDSIKRLIDFLLEIELDLAEFTVLTPFPHTRAFADLEKQKRILSYDWDRYSADQRRLPAQAHGAGKTAGTARLCLGYLLSG